MGYPQPRDLSWYYFQLPRQKETSKYLYGITTKTGCEQGLFFLLMWVTPYIFLLNPCMTMLRLHRYYTDPNSFSAMWWMLQVLNHRGRDLLPSKMRWNVYFTSGQKLIPVPVNWLFQCVHKCDKWSRWKVRLMAMPWKKFTGPLSNFSFGNASGYEKWHKLPSEGEIQPEGDGPHGYWV